MKMKFIDFAAEVGSWVMAEAHGAFVADGDTVAFDCSVLDWDNYTFSKGIVILHLENGVDVTICRDRLHPDEDKLIASYNDETLCEYEIDTSSGTASKKLVWKVKYVSKTITHIVNNAPEIFWRVFRKLDNFTKLFVGFRWGVYCRAVDNGDSLPWQITGFRPTGVDKYYECNVALAVTGEPSLHLLVGEKGIVGIFPTFDTNTPMVGYLNGSAFVPLNNYVKAYTIAFENASPYKC